MMVIKIHVTPGEVLREGDEVRLNEQGQLTKANPDDTDIIGVLPSSFTIRSDGIIELPEYWLDLLKVKRKSQ